MILVAIDPGKNTGWAVFDNGVLINCRVGKWMDAFNEMANQTLNFYGSGIEVLGELPMVYPGPRAEDPNDLIVLAEQLGELLSLYRARGCAVSTVRPRTWKGTVPKNVHNERVLSKLTFEELELVPRMSRAKRYEHNAVDAVGLGLWKLKRM